MTKYLIKLKPLDTFFFSQESKYRKKRGETEVEADYYQQSAYFPQQTTLLGMLRYYVLLKNNQIPITEKTKAEQLIGTNSFDATAKRTYGDIKNLSAVFITDKDNNFYFKNPKDLILKDNKPTYLTKEDSNFKSNLSKEMLFFSNYVEKEGLDSFLINSEENILNFDFDKETEKGVFVKNEKVGIKKNEKGETDDKAFYKQVFYSLNKGYSFGIIAEIDNMEEHKGFVSMGAEKSPFEISFEKINTNIEDKLTLKDTNNPKIVLLSDAYISNYDTNDFQFAISDTKTFRFLKTEVKEGKEYYSSNPLKKGEITRSKKLSLITRGSVFYFKDELQMNTFSEKLNKETNFVQIGYNQHKKTH